jgi:hypothetical protein
MAKRSTRIEVTKIFKSGETVVTVNKMKMNTVMCEQVIERLAKDCENKGETDIDEIKFRCVE